MKYWLCILPSLLLAGCAGAAFPSGADVPPATAETAESAATPAPTAAPPQGLVPTGAKVLDYDDIRMIAGYRARQTYPETDYYTMCKDSLWGLMRSDGTEVLPCRAPAPLLECSWDVHHWHRYADDLYGMAYTDFADQWNARLAATGDGVLCDGHDGDGYLMFIYAQDYIVYTYQGSLGPGKIARPTDAELQLYSASANGLLPTLDSIVQEESDGLVDFCSNGEYAYRYKDSSAVNNSIYSAADFYFDAPLAAAKRDGKWVYLNTDGQEVTDVCYDAVYAYDFQEPSQCTRALPPLNGYTAVSREERFGLLDAAGNDYIPCAYDGLVWDGGTLWLKQEDGWHEYSIPGVTKPDVLDALPESITAPDTRPARTDTVFFTVQTDSDRLNLRAGPGTDYDLVGKIPDCTRLRVYGTLQAAPGWALVQYQQQFGWVSTEYLG